MVTVSSTKSLLVILIFFVVLFSKAYSKLASSSGSVSGPRSRRKVSVLDLREPYINKLRYIIGTFDWSHLFCADNDIDVMYCNFLTTLHSIIDECIPRK